jgi:hypothetical protein
MHVLIWQNSMVLCYLLVYDSSCHSIDGHFYTIELYKTELVHYE